MTKKTTKKSSSKQAEDATVKTPEASVDEPLEETVAVAEVSPPEKKEASDSELDATRMYLN